MNKGARLLLVVASCLFGIGAVTLWLAFSEQSQTRLSQIDDAQQSETALARAMLLRAVVARLDAAQVDIQRAVENPLTLRADLYLSTGREPVFPAPLAPRVTATPERSPAHIRRRELARAFRDAAKADRSAALLRFFEHRETVALDALTEIQTLLEVAEAAENMLARRKTLSALYAALLSGRDGLSPTDAEALTTRSCAVATSFNVSCVRLRELMALKPVLIPGTIPRFGPSIAFIADAAWLLRPQGDGHVGIRVPRRELAADVAQRLSEVLPTGAGAEHSVAFVRGPAAAQPVGAMTLHIDADRYTIARTAARSDARLAHVVVALCFALALFALLFSALLWVRSRRYEQMKQRFYAAVSHELKTPLASMRVIAETLERKLDGDPRAKNYPARLIGDVDQMVTLVDNILSYTRLERGVVKINPENVLGRELVAEVVRELSTAATRPLEVDIDIDESAVWIVDPTWVRVLFSNLLRNARAYNTNDTAHVSVRARPSPQGAVITVADNGVGIESDEHARVFAPFVRSVSSRGPRVRGSGLGLALCRDIVALHGGNIVIDASSEDGTTFRFTLPAAVGKPYAPGEAQVGQT